MKNFNGKVALVTGAARGMGRAMASLLLEEGCKVVLVDLDEKALRDTEKALSSMGDCRGFLCDITKTESVTQLAEDIKDEFGNVSILINNAGIVRAAPILELEERDVRLMFEVNLISLFRTCRIFLPQIIEAGDGHIVNMASAGGILAIPNLSAYSATKFGVIGFSDTLRQEMKKEDYNIGVTYVCPNTVNTGMFNGSSMVKGTAMLTPENVAKRVIHAIRKNKPLCAVPMFSLRIAIPLLKVFLPINGMDRLNRNLGIWTINDTWKGRVNVSQKS
ncbi:MAG: SDR family NAD(P)-dependent oxidoreductase [Spirochaetales bacterium]|nr:SDR family NAD(P)-dependent oxidoreductase [Spirochaetales bacterium]